ncbi:helix-turn-helix transcriptional regulator [Oscillospiraceae bacterium 50-58]
MDNITTGSFIKQLRKEKDMTQKQLAALIGGVLLWRSGRLFILDEMVSPDGTCPPRYTASG